MIPRAQLIHERLMLAGFLPVTRFLAPPEPADARMRRMWRAGKSLALISAVTGFEPFDIKARCAGLPRPAIRMSRFAGCNRRPVAPQGAFSRNAVPTSAGGNAGGLSSLPSVGVP